MYLDANSIYRWALSQYLPTSGIKWFTEKEINKTDLAKYKEDGKKGVILEVDLENPQELHDLHNDFPVAPEKMKAKIKSTEFPLLSLFIWNRKPSKDRSIVQ